MMDGIRTDPGVRTTPPRGVNLTTGPRCTMQVVVKPDAARRVEGKVQT
jgi:hypothetical protein